LQSYCTSKKGTIFMPHSVVYMYVITIFANVTDRRSDDMRLEYRAMRSIAR